MRFTLGVVGIAAILAFGFATPVEAGDAKKLKKQIAKLLNAGEIDQAISKVQELGASSDDKALDTLFTIGKVSPSEKFYEAVVVELMRRDGLMEFLDDKFKRAKRDFQAKVYVANVVSRVDSEEARQRLASYLEDKSTFVKSEAVKGLTKTMHRDAIGPLITLLEELSDKRRDVLYHEVRDALYELTGQDFELIEDWQNWWEPAQHSFDPKEKPKEGKATGVRKKRREDDPDFFGVPVNSKNTLFVIDTSGSMMYVMKQDIRGLARGDGSDGGGTMQGPKEQPTAEDQRLAEFWTRMAMAKRELEKVVRLLKKDALFNMMNFDNNVYIFNKKGAVPANGGQRKKAGKWITALKYRQKGATNTMEALERAFKVDGKINTIFFLSDGLPSVDGENDDPTQPILDRVFALNKFRKIKIHTFGFNPVAYPYPKGGEPYPPLVAANKFLKELAEKTGGTFTVMNVDPKRTPDNPDGDSGEKKRKQAGETTVTQPVAADVR